MCPILFLPTLTNPSASAEAGWESTVVWMGVALVMSRMMVTVVGISEGAAPKFGTAPHHGCDGYGNASVVAQRHMDAADQRADHVVQECENRRQEGEQHHTDNGKNRHRAQHRTQ